MKYARRMVPACAAIFATAMISSVAVGQHLTEPGATPGVELINISKVAHDKFTSVFPMVVVSRKDPNLIAIAWRQFGLPLDTDSPNFIAECHVAVSRDGGKTYKDTDLMRYLRTPGGPNGFYQLDASGMPKLNGCNAPYAAIASDGTIYAGGSAYTTLGSTPAKPILKSGRVGISVSSNGGTSWSPIKVGVLIDKFAPGLKGLNDNMDPNPYTPWDGANGYVDPQTGTFYTGTRGYIAASDDKGETFGTVYANKGTITASFGVVAAAYTMMVNPNERCPCLMLATSTDKGKTWTDHVVARAGEYDPMGAVRYPVAAANPARAGSYAIAAYAPDHRSVKVFYTDDAAKTWKSATPNAIPTSIVFATINQATVGYTTDGKPLVTWRAWRNVAAHNSFVAMLDGDKFGPTIKVTPELSIDPPKTFDTWYNGDFVNWVNGNTTYAFVAFVFAPKGYNQDTWVARVPLDLLKAN